MIHSYRGQYVIMFILDKYLRKLWTNSWCKLANSMRDSDMEDTKRPSTHWEWPVTKYEKQPIKINFASNVLPLPSVSFTRLLANAKELVFTEEVFHHLCQKDGRPGNHPFALIRPKRGPHIEDVVRGGKMPTSSRRNHGIGLQCKSHDGTGNVLRYPWLFSTTSSVS